MEYLAVFKARTDDVVERAIRLIRAGSNRLPLDEFILKFNVMTEAKTLLERINFGDGGSSL